MAENFQDRLQILLEEEKDKEYRIGRREFAKQCGVTPKRMFSWLEGRRRPDYETLMQVAQKLDVSAGWLIGATDQRTITPPKNNDALPMEAQEDYKKILDFLYFKHGIHPIDGKKSSQ